MATTTTQVQNALDKFTETEEKGTFKCESRPSKYTHERFMEVLAKASKDEKISSYWASLINGEGTYYYKY